MPLSSREPPPGVQKMTQGLSAEELFGTPYWIIDILPEQVPAGSPGQYFNIERYLMAPPRRRAVKQKHASLILKANCYLDISLDEGKTFNPPPEQIAEKICTERALVMIGDAMLVSEPDDTYITVYNPDESLLRMLRVLAAGEGLYLWKPGQAEAE